MYSRQSLIIILAALALTVFGPYLSFQGANGHTITKHGDPSGVNGENGNLYFFKLNANRTGIQLDNSQQTAGLSDLVVDNKNELNAVKFGTGFGGITDIKTGPDGYLYILSIVDGNIYRISPVSVPQ